VEVETGKSNVPENLRKTQCAEFDRVVLVAVSPVAVGVCQRAVQAADGAKQPPVETLTWLDVS